MKKFSILFVVMAVVCLTCAAFAQENDFSGYLGVWYADSFCYKGECFPDFLSGYDTKLEIGSDFTVTRIYHYFFSNLYEYENWDDDTFTGQWYTEDDIVYSKLVVNGGSNGKEYAYKYELTEDGNLIEFYSNDSFLIYTRDYRTEWGNGPVKENAELEDFLGKWMVYKTGNPKWVERVDGFDSEVWQYVDGGKGTLNIEKDNIDVNVEAITLWHVNSYEQIENRIQIFYKYIQKYQLHAGCLYCHVNRCQNCQQH